MFEQHYLAGKRGSAAVVESNQAVLQIVKGRHVSDQFDHRVLDEGFQAPPLFFAIGTGFKYRGNTGNRKGTCGHFSFFSGSGQPSRHVHTTFCRDMQMGLNTPAAGHPGMLAAAGILPADCGSNVMDGADIAVFVI